MAELWGIAVIGLFVGLLVGLTSAGTGSLGTTLLIVFYGNPAAALHYPSPVIVGSATVQGAAMKGVGTLRNWLGDTLRSPHALWVVGPAVPFAAVGALFTGPVFEAGFFEPVLAATLLAAAALIAAETALLKRGRSAQMPAIDARYKAGACALGVGVGFLAGLTSVGTGTLTISALILILRVPPREAASIAILSGAVIFFCASVSHFLQSDVDFGVVGLLLAGAVPGILVGTHFRERLDPAPLRFAVAAVIALAAGRLLVKYLTGSNWFGF